MFSIKFAPWNEIVTSRTLMSRACACEAFWCAKVAMMCSSRARRSASDSSALGVLSLGSAAASFFFFFGSASPLAAAFSAFFASRFAFASAFFASFSFFASSLLSFLPKRLSSPLPMALSLASLTTRSVGPSRPSSMRCSAKAAFFFCFAAQPDMVRRRGRAARRSETGGRRSLAGSGRRGGRETKAYVASGRVVVIEGNFSSLQCW